MLMLKEVLIQFCAIDDDHRSKVLRIQESKMLPRDKSSSSCPFKVPPCIGQVAEKQAFIYYVTLMELWAESSLRVKATWGRGLSANFADFLNSADKLALAGHVL